MNDDNYWKDAYKDTWEASSSRENSLSAFFERKTGRRLVNYGLGAGTAEYISGSAEKNGSDKGDADLLVEGTNIYVEVTGPLSTKVKSSAPLWFRPDKVENAIRNASHDTFFVHNCPGDRTWRVIHVDADFVRRYRNGDFPLITRMIRGRRERYVEIQPTDRCILPLKSLVGYIKEYRES